VEYAGGYTDMLAQRGADLAGVKSNATPAPRTQRAPEAVAPPRPAKAARRRLSFNDKHALETLPGEIEALHASLRRLHDRLGDPGLYARDRQAFAQASAALSATQAELAAAEQRWFELELLREEIEGG
jgi:ATP-binding cassette subfamily F protein uup